MSFQGAAGRVDFVDGQNFGFVNVTVRDNGIPEGEKMFQVRMISQVRHRLFIRLMIVNAGLKRPSACKTFILKILEQNLHPPPPNSFFL